MVVAQKEWRRIDPQVQLRIVRVGQDHLRTAHHKLPTPTHQCRKTNAEELKSVKRRKQTRKTPVLIGAARYCATAARDGAYPAVSAVLDRANACDCADDDSAVRACDQRHIAEADRRRLLRT
jgi:hypothetical protein